MEKTISIVIPNYNGAETIGKCLEAAFASEYKNFDVVVVDDCSDDNSIEIISRFPCKLVRLEHRSGASKARNTGALSCSSEIIFFTDADCLLRPDALSTANRALASTGPDVVLGGTYTLVPHDQMFCSIFQSVFVNYSETKKPENPDYIAAHAMIMYTDTFKQSGGFPEIFLPIMEDLEFSHRLRRSGIRFRMIPEIQVEHIFNFSLVRSLSNAFRKTRYWVMYSQKNRDMLTDSGTASVELKFNVFSYALIFLLIAAWLISRNTLMLYLIPVITACNILISRNLIKAFFKAKGGRFAGAAFLYYTVLYPIPVGTGTIAGLISNLARK